MQTEAKIAAGVAGGYLLGRRHKAKLAVGLGLWLTGRKLTLDPTQLARQMGKLPLTAALREQVGTQLGGAGRKALSAAVSSRTDAWAESLGRRTADLRAGHGARRAADDQAPAGEEEFAEEEDEASPAPRRRTTRARKATASSGRSARRGSDA